MIIAHTRLYLYQSRFRQKKKRRKHTVHTNRHHSIMIVKYCMSTRSVHMQDTINISSISDKRERKGENRRVILEALSPVKNNAYAFLILQK